MAKSPESGSGKPRRPSMILVHWI